MNDFSSKTCQNTLFLMKKILFILLILFIPSSFFKKGREEPVHVVLMRKGPEETLFIYEILAPFLGMSIQVQ